MNIEGSLAEAFDGLGYAVTRTGTDLQQNIRAHDAVVKVSQTGGPIDRLQGRYRVVVEVYAATYAKAWQVADRIEARLLASPLWAADVLIDRARCEGSFAERPYTESTRVLVSTWAVTARHHTRRTASA